MSPHQPWLYLLYLCAFFVPWLYRTPGREEVLVSILSVALFLVLFVIAMIRRDGLALPAAAITLGLGFVLLPGNFGASVFLVYAAAMLARVRNHRLRRLGLAGWALAIIGVSVFIGLPWVQLVGYLVFGALIAAATAWSARRQDLDALQEDLEADAAARAAEAERQRIARDLHDLLGHTLSVITLKADLAGRVFDADPARARSELAAIETISRQALTDVREAVTGLRARPLDEVAHEVALRLREAGLEVTLEMNGPRGLPDGVLAALGMVMREGATNVLRHADARSVGIVLEPEADGWRLAIHDDGRGGVRFGRGGLDGLRTRLAEAGISLALGPGPGGRGSALEAVWTGEVMQ